MSSRASATTIDALKAVGRGPVTDSRAKAWSKLANYYKSLAAERAAEGTSVQLACLVLANYCALECSGDYGGPSLEMVALAENTAGESLDEKIAAELAKAGT